MLHTTAAITPQRGAVARPAAHARTTRRVVCASNAHKTLGHAVTTTPAAVFAASLLSAAPAMADDLPIDASAALEAASSLAVSADPVLIAAAGAIAILGGGAFALNNSISAGKVRGTTPEKALDALAQEARVVLVDIRSKQAIKEDGSPDLKIVKRKPVAVPFTEVVGEEITPVEGFVDKLLANPSIKEDSILILIDSYVDLFFWGGWVFCVYSLQAVPVFPPSYYHCFHPPRPHDHYHHPPLPPPSPFFHHHNHCIPRHSTPPPPHTTGMVRMPPRQQSKS